MIKDPKRIKRSEIEPGKVVYHPFFGKGLIYPLADGILYAHFDNSYKGKNYCLETGSFFWADSEFCIDLYESPCCISGGDKTLLYLTYFMLSLCAFSIGALTALIFII